MQHNRTSKIIAAFLLISQLAFWPAVILAQVAVPTSDTGLGNNTGGPAGVIQNTAEAKALSAAFAIYQTCLSAVQAAEQVASKANVGLSTISVLSPSGNSAQLNAMNTLSAAYYTFLNCDMTQYLVFDGSGGANSGLPASSLYTSNMKEQYVSRISAGWTTYSKKSSDLDARIENSNQGFWKTLLVSLLLQTSKAVADALVSKLVNNYKISNLKQYADSAATLMYDNQFIRENFPNAQDQLMARAILTNPAFRSQIQPGIFVAANAALGYNPNAINPASPNFYGQMAAMGSPSANPYYLQTAYVGGVDQSRAASMATAQQQISQGSGYKAPVNCAGSLTQQRQVDMQYQALQAQAQNRDALLANLTAAVNSGQKVSASDLAKAQADDNAAQLALVNAPQAVMSSSGSTSTNPAIIMCEAISSPAVLVNQGIDALFNAVGGNLTQYNGSNLPAYINTITGIASQIGTSMVLGGVGAGASSALINENKAIAATAALAASTNSAANSSTSGINGSSNFVIGIYPSSGNNTLVNWQVLTSNLPTASYVTVTGPGAPTGHLSLTGNMTVSPTTNTSYVLTVFDATGKTLGSTNMNVFVDTSSSQSFNYNPNAPTVAGAFTNRPVVATRGPVAQLSIR
jgi:hypothetical protein